VVGPLRQKPFRPPSGNPLDRMMRSKTLVHTVDAAAEQNKPMSARLAGARTHIVVPMLKDDELIGALSIYRTEVRPFTDKQIELVSNFAKQAVIAIENTRLLNELRQRTDDLSESLEQQTATSDVLQVISSSPGELGPVFQAMLEKAVELCHAKFGNLVLFKGGEFRVVAMHGAPRPYEDLRRRSPAIPPRTARTILGALMETAQVVHIADLAAEERYADSAIVKLASARTFLSVPMLKEGQLIGGIEIYRQEVRPFTDKQIELVKSSANQAVIAIENPPLLNDLRESLQQQPATADVLKVISRSTFDLQIVLNTLVQSAVRLCEGDMGAIDRQQGGELRQVASYGQPPAMMAFMETHPIPAGRGSVVGRTIQGGAPGQITDVLADSEFELTEAANIGGVRTMLGVPLLREGRPIGVMVLQRKAVRPFTDKQIELITTFADQAVIAIENVRLFEAEQQRTRELSQALEQQTASAEVLGVISGSPGELEPVFQAMLANAMRICEAKFGHLVLYDGEGFHAAYLHDVPQAYRELWDRGPVLPGPKTGLRRVLDTKQVVHIADLAAEPAYAERDPLRVATVEIAGGRTFLGVPMLKENQLVGAIIIYRQEVRPFSDKQIELVSNFAKQAVIAIENTRLLNELRESLQQQMATSEVLGVISSSPGELQPVFDALAH